GQPPSGQGPGGPGPGGTREGAPPTQYARGRDTSPDLTASHLQFDPYQGGGGYQGGGRRRPWWRSPGAIAAAVILLIILGGGGGYLALHKTKKTDTQTVAALKLPPCTSQTANASSLTVPSQSSDVPNGQPFGIQVTHDNKFVFTVTPLTVEVFSRAPDLALTHMFTYTVTNQGMGAAGATMTSNGKYLLVAAGSGIVVMDVHSLEVGANPAAIGTMTVPDIQGNGGAVEVAVSPDNHFAFLTLKNVDIMAVFNLRKAIKHDA